MDVARQIQAAIRDVIDPLVVMRRVVDQALALIPDADGAAVELAHDGHLTYVCASGSLAEHVGMRLRLDESLSGLAISLDETLHCEDAAADTRVDRDACLRVGAVSLVCVPLRRGSEAIGVLKVSAGRARAFSDAQVEILATLANFITAAIGAVSDIAQSAERLLSSAPPSSVPQAAADSAQPLDDEYQIGTFVVNVLQPGVATDLTTKRRIERVLSGGLRLVCQPIVELNGGQLVGVETLARFAVPPEQPPEAWFSQAHAVGLGVELELLAVRMSLELLEQIPPDVYLAINVGPETLVAPELQRQLDARPCERVVIELTEHLQVDDYPHVRQVLHCARERGVRLAIDDTGAGFSSLSHIVNLAPDLIKLDRRFTTGIDVDPVRRALAQALVSFAQETGAKVIAEGIETTAELDTVRDLGIPYGQGYLIARPAPVATVFDGSSPAAAVS